MATLDNGILEPDIYPARTNTWAAGDQVAAADLNAIQDGIITVSAGLDFVCQYIFYSRTCNSNGTSGLPNPERSGACEVWIEAETNGVTEIVLDDSIDWRDRHIFVEGWADEAGNLVFPGEAGDDSVEADLSNVTAPGVGIHAYFYSEQGSAGTFADPGAHAVISTGPTESLVISVNASGELVMRMSPWTSVEGRVVARVSCSPKQNHY